MPLVPWWALLLSGIAPVLLIGGWLAAACLQPTRYDPLIQTISSLAALDATDRWLMTAVLAVVGGCYVVTAHGLDRVRRRGRTALKVGGVSAILVALSPEPGHGATSLQHLGAAGLGFFSLMLWPCLAMERSPAAPWPLRPAAAIGFTSLVFGSAVWFLAELHGHGDAGLAERVVTGLQSVWPVVVVGSLRRDVRPHTALLAASLESRATADSPSV